MTPAGEERHRLQKVTIAILIGGTGKAVKTTSIHS
jgi:hypothetical protein